MAIDNQVKELALLSIIRCMAGRSDSSDDTWHWMRWFTNDELHGVHSDTFNRCHEKGWLRTSHNSLDETSTTYLTTEGTKYLQESDRSTGSVPSPLSERQLKIVGMLAEGLPAKNIAARLGVSVFVVHEDCQRAYRASEVNNAASLVAVAVRRGWIK